MVEKAEVKPESLLNLDDLLQCPVCYEIPTGQIFQCNEGHHVCGRCKMRLDVCPVCRALFFGTRNYAMEELISNFRKMRSLKLGSKASGSGSSESSTPAKENTSVEHENDANDDADDNDEDENNTNIVERPPGPPQPCSGLFRCLCCKTGKAARLPSARLLNHLRYFHAPDLLEGRSENGEYLQAWQFSTVPGKLVTAVRISDMGIFFLTIEINSNLVCAWLSMAASPWVAHEFSYTITICGNDREAIFSDCVWSVRSCEGALKKRGHCLVVQGRDAQALTAPPALSGKLSVRRTPSDQLTAQSQPRAVMRIANRVNQNNHTPDNDIAPFLLELQDDVARLSRAFATLGREANALVHSEARMLARIENFEHAPDTSSGGNARASDSDAEPTTERAEPQQDRQGLSRNARRRLRQRMRAALDGEVPSLAPTQTNQVQAPPATTQPRQNVPVTQPRQNAPVNQPRQDVPVTQPRQNVPVNQPRQNAPIAQPRQNTSVTQPRQNAPVTQPRQNTAVTQPRQNTPSTPMRSNVNQTRPNAPDTQPRENGLNAFIGHAVVIESLAPVAPSPVAPSSSSASQSQAQPQTGNGNRNKKKRRHRR
ncbi:uncharacterized protein LOC123864462 isoform X2 [Maniola jurtina]|uniref:uncharacterized protein LOC123864462 isoform X2 n=1 Tax=Maniola jurtina TaxID=191418 RepID=UPI001E687A78|nr:uncharacterized protein LOC123864462 isoform X2 [Maniola jurtina]